MFEITYFQYNSRKVTKVYMNGLETMTNLHENGELVIETIKVLNMGGLILSYEEFWDHYNDLNLQ